MQEKNAWTLFSAPPWVDSIPGDPDDLGVWDEPSDIPIDG